MGGRDGGRQSTTMTVSIQYNIYILYDYLLYRVHAVHAVHADCGDSGIEASRRRGSWCSFRVNTCAGAASEYKRKSVGRVSGSTRLLLSAIRPIGGLRLDRVERTSRVIPSFGPGQVRSALYNIML